MLDPSSLDVVSSWFFGVNCSSSCIAVGLLYLLIYLFVGTEQIRDLRSKFVKAGYIVGRVFGLIYASKRLIWKETLDFFRSPRGYVEIFFTSLWIFSYFGLIEVSTVGLIMTLYVCYLKKLVETTLPKLMKTLPVMITIMNRLGQSGEDSDSEEPPRRMTKAVPETDDDDEYQ